MGTSSSALVGYQGFTPDRHAERGYATISCNEEFKSTDILLWQDLSNTLLDWLSHPDALADDGALPPEKHTIKRALNLIDTLRKNVAFRQLPPPVALPTGDGGMALNWEFGKNSFSIEIEPNLRIELLSFSNNKLRMRETLYYGNDRQ